MAIHWIKEVELCEFDKSDIEENNELNKHNNANLWVSGCTLMQWFRDFCCNKEKFINIPKRRSQIDWLPPSFDLNPDLKDNFISYAKENLTDLCAELMFEYVNDVLIPKLIVQERKETDDHEITRDHVLKQYRIKIST